MKRILLISLALAVLFGVACKEATTPLPVVDYTPETPEECISSLEKSFNDHDITLYKAMLSSNFTFYFNQADVGTDVDGFIIPASWGYEDDWTATEDMFTQAYDISMQLPEGDIGTPPEGATEYTVENISISLLVMIDETNGFIANKGTCTYTFEKVSDSGDEYWVIKDWRDFTYARKGIKSVSLGMIKALWKDGKPRKR